MKVKQCNERRKTLQSTAVKRRSVICFSQISGFSSHLLLFVSIPSDYSLYVLSLDPDNPYFWAILLSGKGKGKRTLKGQLDTEGRPLDCSKKIFLNLSLGLNRIFLDKLCIFSDSYLYNWDFLIFFTSFKILK